LADDAGHRIASAQSEAAHEGVGDVDVVRAGVVAAGADEPGVLLLDAVEDAGDGQQHVVLGNGRLGVSGRGTAGPIAVTAPPGAIATATAAPAVEVVVAGLPAPLLLLPPLLPPLLLPPPPPS